MSRKLALVVIAFGLACAGPTLAFDADDLAKVKAGEVCIGCNLSYADLTRASLYGAYLYGADLTGADLTGADLTGADLSGADLSGASLRGANLSRAEMRRAILCNTTVSDGSVIYSGC
jgi:uncharacterized protein YjbI with pentapeptide repeats